MRCSGFVLIQEALLLSDYAEAGRWSLSRIDAYDRAGNRLDLHDWGNPDDDRDLSANGYSGVGFNVINQKGDITPPAPSSLLLGTQSIGLAPDEVYLPFEFTFTDDISGLNEAYISFRSPSGQYSAVRGWFQADNNLLSGNSKSGTLSGSLTVPGYAEEGRWTLESISLRDNAGNDLTLWDSQDPNSDVSLAAYGLDGISFVAGDLIEWDRSLVFEGGSADLLITAANQQSGTQLWYTLSGEGDEAITEGDIAGDRQGWITLDQNRQASITVALRRDGVAEEDEWLYADLFTDNTESWAVGSGAAIRVADQISNTIDLSHAGQSALAASALWSDASGLDHARLTFTRIDDTGAIAATSSGSGYFSNQVEIQFNDYRSLLSDTQAPSEEHLTLFAGDSATIREAGIYELTRISFDDQSSSSNYRWYERSSTNTSEYDHNLEAFLEESGLNLALFRFEAIGTPRDESFAGDTTLPELTAFSWGERIRELDDGSGVLSAEATFEDESGLDSAYLSFRSGDSRLSISFSDWSTRRGNDTNTSQKHVTWLSIPFDTEPGNYTLDSISLDDKANNYSYLSGSTLADYFASIGLDADQLTFTIPDSWPKAPQSGTDLDAPEIINISITNRTLDLSSGSGLIINLQIADASGLDYGSLRWQKEGTSNWENSLSLSLSDWASLAAFDAEAQRHIGLLFPRASTTEGTYQLSSLWLEDTKGNRTSELTGNSLTEYLQSVGIDPDDLSLTLSGTRPEIGPQELDDSDATSLNSFELSTLVAQAGAAHSLNAGTDEKSLRIELDVSDDISGFFATSDADQYMGEVELLHSNGIDRIWTSIHAGDFKATGTNQGTFSITVPINRDTKNGTWSVASVSLRDLAGNWRYLDPISEDLSLAAISREHLAKRLGLSNGRELGIEITGGAASDGTGFTSDFSPIIRAASFDQTSIDLTNQSSQTLTLSLVLDEEDLELLQSSGTDTDGQIRTSEAWIYNSITGEQLWAQLELSQGIVKAIFELDDSAASGSWQLGGVQLVARQVSDDWSGGGYFTTDEEVAELSAEILATRLDVAPDSIMVEVNNPTRPAEDLRQDRTAPFITSVNFSTNEIDLNSGSRSLSLYLDFIDPDGRIELAGWLGHLELISADGQQSVDYNLISSSGEPTESDEARVSLLSGGDPNKGTLEINIPLGDSLRSGKWLINQLALRDESNNERSINLLINGGGRASSADSGSGYFSNSGINEVSVSQLAQRLGSSNEQIGFTVVNNLTPTSSNTNESDDILAPLITDFRISTPTSDLTLPEEKPPFIPAPPPATPPAAVPPPASVSPPVVIPEPLPITPPTPPTPAPAAAPEQPKTVEALSTVVQGLDLETIKANNPEIEIPVLQLLEAIQAGSAIKKSDASAKKDPITGTNSDDVIIPSNGRSALQGGDGADTFAFVETDKFGKRGADRITDFDPKEGDKIVISDAAFNGLTEIKFKTVRSKQGLKQALKSEATIVYDATTGNLYFDANGSLAGQGSGGLFATLNGRPKLSADDFALLLTSELAT